MTNNIKIEFYFLYLTALLKKQTFHGQNINQNLSKKIFRFYYFATINET